MADVSWAPGGLLPGSQLCGTGVSIPVSLVDAGGGWLPPARSKLDNASGVGAHVLDHLKTGLWVARSDGTDKILTPWRLNGSGVWAAGTDVALGTGKSPHVLRLPDNSIGFSYVTSGSVVKWAVYNPQTGLGTEETVNNGTLCDSAMDLFGRVLVALYDGAWKVAVGVLAAGGTSRTWTVATMGLTGAQAKRGSLRVNADGAISFFYASSAHVITHALNRNLANDGTGAWTTALETVGDGAFCDHVIDKLGRVVVVLYNDQHRVSVGVLNSGGLTHTWNDGTSPVAMGIATAQAKRGSLEVLPEGALSFMYFNSGGNVAHIVARDLAADGSGLWS